MEAVEKLERSLGIEIHFNWFFRSDLQMEKAYGDAAWPFKAWKDLVLTIIDRQDELGWHPHLWRLLEDGGSWFQETEDADYMVSCMRRGFESIPRELRPRAARTGWDFHNAVTMKCLSDLGIVADLSALPGISSKGAFDARSGRYMVVRDWTGAPDHPYFPSGADPRKPARAAAERLGVLEIPVSTYPLPPALRLAKGVRSLVRGKGKRLVPSEPYVTRSRMLFKAALEHHLTRRDAVEVPFVAEFHADELLHERGDYSIRNVLENISLAVSLYGKAGMIPRFKLAGEVADDIRKRLGE